MENIGWINQLQYTNVPCKICMEPRLVGTITRDWLVQKNIDMGSEIHSFLKISTDYIKMSFYQKDDLDVPRHFTSSSFIFSPVLSEECVHIYSATGFNC